MFSGIVEEVGVIGSAAESRGNLRVRINAELVTGEMKVGDSVAVSGCCLTVVAHDAAGFEVEASSETLAKTAPRWREGARVNLERALKVSGRLGGHIVTGHVDGVAKVLERREEPGSLILKMRAPEAFAPHFVPKGSVTIDGVSLTLVDVGGPGGNRPEWPATDFTLWLIPHTLQVTTLGELAVGANANLESDLLAKYAERQELLRRAAQPTGSGA